VTYPDDILAEDPRRRQLAAPSVAARRGLVVEHIGSRFCGDVVDVDGASVGLRDRDGRVRRFVLEPGAFRVDGKVVTLTRPVAPKASGPAITASGSIAAGPRRAAVASASRIWVEGRHDAELVEHVWGDDLRELGIVVEPMHGIDDLVASVREFGPGPQRRLGILVDHLVPGSKEQRLADSVRGPAVLVTGHPFVDVWAGVRPKSVGISAWPDVPRGQPWKEGVCRALGWDPVGIWPKLRNQVNTFADLRPELVGAVEQLIDFVAPS
jgi:Protein of unknown function (DUF3097)